MRFERHDGVPGGGDKKYWLGIKLVPAFRNRQYVLAEKAGGPRALWESDHAALSELGLTDKDVAETAALRAAIDLEEELEKLRVRGISVITDEDADFPQLLLDAPWHPKAFFIKGTLPECAASIAIVGSRHATLQGKAFAMELASALAASGVLIVSGGARGIDTAAHTGALEAGGLTAAVLGCGLDLAYPPENRNLFAQIEERAALISEYPLGTQPFPRNFPARNRIVAGMCNGVVVVEAALKSGALITADFALEYGRDVFAAPGYSKSPMSKGANALIKQGAHLIESAQDVIDVLSLTGITLDQGEPLETLSGPEKDFLIQLGWEPKRFDEVTCNIPVDKATASVLLLTLEISGFVKRDIDGCYLRIK
ncbi:MAG: DNA-processing protein DprA [Actinomycetota bacterium]|nr:DNA-processing protein DprA [Actinomycetota bacterium]